MAFDGAALPGWLAQIQPNNAKGEFYLTDAVGLAAKDGRRMVIVEAEEEELMGLDDQVDLAAGEAVMQGRLRRAAMVAGATASHPPPGPLGALDVEPGYTLHGAAAAQRVAMFKVQLLQRHQLVFAHLGAGSRGQGQAQVLHLGQHGAVCLGQLADDAGHAMALARDVAP
eukprot:gene1217-1516_t